MSERPICFKKYTPPPSFSFVRPSVSFVESFARSFARRSFVGRNRARVSFVSYARSDAFSTSSPLSPPSVRHLHYPRRLTAGENYDNRNESQRKGWRRRKRARKGGSFIFFLHSSRRRRRRTHARARDGTVRKTKTTSHRASRVASLSPRQGKTNAPFPDGAGCLPRRVSLSREWKRFGERSFCVEFRSCIFIFLRTSFERGSS